MQRVFLWDEEGEVGGRRHGARKSVGSSILSMVTKCGSELHNVLRREQ